MNELKTKIGLEIHVQLATKSKMFCSCDNEAFQVKPNTTVCPVCLGQPGSLPVANRQAVEWTIKTGLSLGCEIGKIAKFDRKHYFYPDLPKGYQISQYDEPFAIGGSLKLKVESEKLKGGEERTIRLNRIHLEEDAGKLVHEGGKSYVDLNRAGTPLMEIVTEPDITSPLEAGEFLRKLQKIVRDVVKVSEASMEKGHLRCDANISVNDGDKMSEIVELKNLNSFRFVEKALEIEEARLREEYPEWAVGKKVTRGYDSKKNITFAQRTKEEAADYRYFPEPDLPPFDSSDIDLEALKKSIGISEEDKIAQFVAEGVAESDAKVLVSDKTKEQLYCEIIQNYGNCGFVAKAIVQNYFGIVSTDDDATQFAKALESLEKGKISKNLLLRVAEVIHNEKVSFEAALEKQGGGMLGDESGLRDIISKIIDSSPKETESYRQGKKQLLGFFVGQVMKETQGKADPKKVNEILQELLG